MVRKAEVKDLVAINELTDAMHNYLAGLYELKLADEELEEEHFSEEQLENVYVAESAEEGVIGYVSFSKGSDEWAGPIYEIDHIVVDQDYRGLGIGRKLFEIVLERALREGANITTGTLVKNERALRFYQEQGFKPLSIRLVLDLQRRLSTKRHPTHLSSSQ